MSATQVTESQHGHAPREPSSISNNSISYSDSLSTQLQLAAKNGVTDFCLYFTPADANIQTFPKRPFELKRFLSSVTSSPERISQCFHTRQGKLLIKTSDLSTALDLCSISSILSVPCNISMPIDYLTTKFLLRDVSLDLSLLQLSDEISENNLSAHHIRRFTRKGSSDLTETVLVTVFGSSLPPTLNLFYTRTRISLFVDNVRQCSRCFQFSHATLKCPAPQPLCVTCGDTHTTSDCTASSPVCANCAGAHIATCADCPSRSREASFLRFKCEQHLPFVEARRRFRQDTPRTSFAAVTQSPVQPPLMQPNYQDIKSIVTSVVKEVTASFESKLLAISRRQDEMFEKLLSLIHAVVGARAGDSHSPVRKSKKKRKKQPSTTEPAPSAEPVLSEISMDEADSETSFRSSIAERVKSSTPRRVPS